jgi:diguanylate cyclase (GGDEF)-like protein
MHFDGATTDAKGEALPDIYRGAHYDTICRGSGVLAMIGGLGSLVLMPFFPPTALIGAWGWALVIPSLVFAIGIGLLRATLRLRPSVQEIYISALAGPVQIACAQWLAGGGKALYMQLLVVPVLGSAASQSLRRCGWVVLVALAAAFSPLLYSSIDVAATAMEYSMLGIMTLVMSAIITSTRTHRAQLIDAGEYADKLAHVDPLTGLPNRRAFDEVLALGIESARLDGTPLSLVLCDVNSFKQINDSFGHATGDEVLEAIARALTEAVRRPEAAFRWAGDEFAVILLGATQEGAERVAERLRETVRERCRRPDGRPVTIGAGVAALEPGMSGEDFLAEADRALFADKAAHGQLRGVA